MSNITEDSSQTGGSSILEHAAAVAVDSPRARTLEQRRERRREETDRKILQATLHIVATQGIGAVTIEEVARRSGVAKTTIYRRYRNTDDMLRRLSTMQWPASIITPTNLEPSRGNLQHMLEAATTRFDEEIGLKAVGAVLSANNGYFEQIVQQVIQPVKQRFAEFFAQGQQAGVFRGGLDLSFIFATIVGSMMANQALTDETGMSWAAQLPDLLWPMIAA